MLERVQPICDARAAMSLRSILSHPLVYKVWQSPFAARKLKPFLRAMESSPVTSILDIGCGPGTNYPALRHLSYVGVDLSPEYIAHASATFGGDFRVGDACHFTLGEPRQFDTILMNSLLHHLDDHAAHTALVHARSFLQPDGRVHILDLDIPQEPSIARLMAQYDRGDFPRPVAKWRELFGSVFEEIHFENYPLGLFGIRLWSMVYFQGKLRQE